MHDVALQHTKTLLTFLENWIRTLNSKPHHGPPPLPRNRWITAAALAASFTALMAVFYVMVFWACLQWPGVLFGFRDGLASILFTCAAASAWLLALGLWQSRHSEWSLEHQLSLRGALGLIPVLLLISLQFADLGPMNYWSYRFLSILKTLAYFGLLLYLFMAWRKIRLSRGNADQEQQR